MKYLLFTFILVKTTVFAQQIENSNNLKKIEYSISEFAHALENPTAVYRLNLCCLGDPFKFDFEQLALFPNLEYLNLSGNRLDSLPQIIFSIKSLTELDISINPNIKHIPEEIGNLHNLTSLNIRQCWVEKLPESIGNLHKLTYFWADANELQDLPKSFERLKQLQKLGLRYNQFTVVPSQIFSCNSLIDLDLSNNEITSISSDFSKLFNLKYLRLSENSLTVLPEKIASFLPAIELLDLSANAIKQLNKELLLHKNLKTLFILDTQISAIDPCIYQNNVIQRIIFDYQTFDPAERTKLIEHFVNNYSKATRDE